MHRGKASTGKSLIPKGKFTKFHRNPKGKAFKKGPRRSKRM